MNLIVYSADENVLNHFKFLFSENQDRVIYLTDLSELALTLETSEPVMLIFHLAAGKNAEAGFIALQQRLKGILNTLVLTNTPDQKQGVRLLSLNVRGYANTYIDSHKLETALTVIQQGEVWIGSSMIEYLLGLNQPIQRRSDDLEDFRPAEPPVFTLLSEREQQIAQKVLTGLQNKLIADELNITERTVKAHLTTIFKKLGVKNRLELMLKLQQADRRERVERRKTS